MNSLKNVVVTAMLLAVAYGAYVVLHQPPSRPSVDESGDSNWPQDDSAAALEPPMVALGEPAVSEMLPTDRSARAGQPPEQGRMADPNDESLGGAMEPRVDPHRPPAQGELPLPWQTVSDDEAGSLPTGTPSAGSNPDAQPTSPPVSAGPPQFTGPPEFSGAADGPSEGGGWPADASPAGAASAGQHGAIPSAAFEDAWQSVQEKLGEHLLAEALLELSMWYYDPSLSAEQTRRCLELLDRLAGTVIYSRQCFLEPPYVVQAGDTLESIATSYQVPSEMLAKINGIPPGSELVPGEEIKVLRGPFEAEVSRERGEMTLFLGRYYAGRFAVALGGNLPAGEVEFEVAERALGHAFFDPRSGRQVSADDPQNPFQGHWIGLRGETITAAHNVGIHAGSPSAPADPLSGIILSPQDAEDVHAILSVGSRVRIRR